MFDYIIVGAGSAGCVLANRLSANSHNKVCLIEAGPQDKHPMIHVPLGLIGMMHSKVMNWRYYTEPEPALNERKLFWPRGKTLGGSSSSNAMCYIRGHASDYDHWASLGNAGWSYQDVLPYFRKAEHQEFGEDIYHGSNGPLHVSELRIKNPLSQAFIKAAKQAGLRYNDDFNGQQQEGIGFYQVTQKNGQRCSSAVAYLREAETRDNLTIITNAMVNKVLIDNGVAVGVEYQQGGEIKAVHARKEVILSGGAINSPQLLMLSGIGDKEHLNAHGIECVADLPGVGQNLQDHLDILVVTRERTFHSVGFSPIAMLRAIKGVFDYWLFRQGNFTTNVAEAGGFLKTDDGLDKPDVQFHFSPCFLDNHGLDLLQTVKHGYSLHACCLRPKSRGVLMLRDSNPQSPPILQPNYLSHPDDIEVMLKGLKVSRQILAQKAFDHYRGKEAFPGKEVATDDELRSFIRQKAESIYHPVGTCKMGNDKAAVVDSCLRVRGVEQLRVVDASIMPTLIGGNTNAPTIMIAEKASDLILQDNIFEASDEITSVAV
ncbi:GMC family oxidoreductase [Photobacterium damselae]|uniref:GMC family oxidoreductase n=1 Tax=Photobacterium damselae TaxID=38293 RepID=UPI001592C130|nr:choline dehydrogenase [Photobacterium damselae]NVH47279.1 choline dehydrogenase [Photobacterium damselae subsp. damselae]